MSEPTTTPEITPRFSPVRWFLTNAKWHGAEWWITSLGGVFLLLILLMTIFASKLAPYDPVKFVGKPFNRPGGRQSVVILQDADESIQGLEDLPGRKVGVVLNTQAVKELEEREIAFQEYRSIRKTIEALRDGEIEALVTDKSDPKFKGQVKKHEIEIKSVGAPFGERFILGTDNFGRDVFSRLIYGGQTVLLVAILAALLSAGTGVPLGLLSGFFGGWFDRILSLIMDSVYSFPGLILAIAMAALLGQSMYELPILKIDIPANVTVAIAVIYIPVYFRLVRSKVLSVKEELYIEAARSLGTKAWTILWQYVFPNVIPSIVVIFSVNVADSILTEAGLSFLGLGPPPTTPDWGVDLSSGKRFIPSGYWWIITFPGMMIALLTLGFSMLGEGLNEILNPRLTEN